jgi:DNA-binding response OmpR family regulator
VRVAHTGWSALASAREFRPQAVLLDLGLPDMNGLEVVAKLREMPEIEHAVLIALSGRGEPEDRRLTQAAGFHHHVVKPASADELERLIMNGNVAG